MCESDHSFGADFIKIDDDFEVGAKRADYFLSHIAAAVNGLFQLIS